MQKKQKYIALIVCLVILALVIFFKAKDVSSPQAVKNINEATVTPQINNTLSATIIVAEETLNPTFTQGESLYNILLKEKEANKISFSGKEYSGMGFFMTDIGTLHSTKDHYLMYYINGKEAEIGISSYFPQNGDVIEWKLK